MRALVTGGAGFIGSHLAGAIVAGGDQVRIVDCLTPYYDGDQKRANLAAISALATDAAGVHIVDADLGTDPLESLLDGIDVVFHQAGQPGVRSGADGFDAYDANNVRATLRLLEACRNSSISRFVYASSSSIYGDAERYPTDELDLPRPRSHYGVTKLAAEHLCDLYAATWGVPVVTLRYFTVYGPRQRPDMAFHRLCEAALSGGTFPMYGDGGQIRDFTYVDDVVTANRLAATADLAPGDVMNIAGGSSVTLSAVIETIGELAGRPIALDRRPAQSGDVSRTSGSTERAQRLLGWEPRTDLRTGLGHQLAWHRDRRS